MLRSRQLDSSETEGKIVGLEERVVSECKGDEEFERMCSEVERMSSEVPNCENNPHGGENCDIDVQKNTTSTNLAPTPFQEDRNDPMELHKSRNDLADGRKYPAMPHQDRNDPLPTPHMNMHKSRNDLADGRNYPAMRHQDRNDPYHNYTFTQGYTGSRFSSRRDQIDDIYHQRNPQNGHLFREAEGYDSSFMARPIEEPYNSQPFQMQQPLDRNVSSQPGRWVQPSISRLQQNEPRPKLPSFDGRSEWQSFIVPFNLLAERFDWGRRRQCEEIMLCLTSEAQIFASKLPVQIRSNLDSLCAEMKKRFGDHTLPETYRRNLRSLRKASTESYQKYAARVAEAVRKGFPGIHGDLF